MSSPLKRGFKAKKPKSHLRVFFFFLCSALVLTSGNAHEPLHKAKGDSVVLDPNYAAPFITSIVWSHDSGMVAEWFGGETTFFRQFKGRCSLDFYTGALTITGADESDNGLYSVEINDNKIDSKIQLSVISKVSKPSILVKCNTEKTACNLTCDGNTTNAEPVSYKWFPGDDGIGSNKKFKITKDTKEESFTCMMLNPVSNQSSDSSKNPIIIDDERNPMAKRQTQGRPTTIIIIIILIIVSIVVIILIGIYIFVTLRKKDGRYNLKWLSKGKEQGTKDEGREMHPNGEGGQNQDNPGNTSGTGETPVQNLTVPEFLNSSKESS